MLDRAPSVAITHDRNELKVYQGNLIYLNDGDNFELHFFNPLQEKVGVEINFNSIRKGDGYLVLNPGQDLILDRFLDEQRKMIFETYVIDGNNEAAVKAIQQNGLISFNFYKEQKYNYYNPCNDINVNYNFPPKPIKYKKSKGFSSASGTGGTSGANGTCGTNNITYNSSGVYGACGSPGFPGSGTFTSSNTFHTPGTSERDLSYIATTNTVDYNSKGTTTFYTSTCDSFNMFSPLETGRIEKGDISDQYLRSVNAQFETTPFHSISYKIMPYSAMNREIGEIRAYCSGCGYRLRKETWQFCPKCGAKIL